MLIFNSM